MVDDPRSIFWSGLSASFRTTIAVAIQGMLDSVTFSEVTLEGVVPAMSDDQIFTMDLNIMGDGSPAVGHPGVGDCGGLRLKSPGVIRRFKQALPCVMSLSFKPLLILDFTKLEPVLRTVVGHGQSLPTPSAF